jgi:hypothetical protein
MHSTQGKKAKGFGSYITIKEHKGPKSQPSGNREEYHKRFMKATKSLTIQTNKRGFNKCFKLNKIVES